MVASTFSTSKVLPPLDEKLREDELIPDDLDKALAAFPPKKIFYSRSQLLYTLNDAFIVDFSSQLMSIMVIHKQGMQRIRLQQIFTDFRDKSKEVPYTGAYTSHHLLKLPINIY